MEFEQLQMDNITEDPEDLMLQQIKQEIKDEACD